MSVPENEFCATCRYFDGIPIGLRRDGSCCRYPQRMEIVFSRQYWCGEHESSATAEDAADARAVAEALAEPGPDISAADLRRELEL